MSESRTNPFPGPQPYRATDRGRFYGRDAVSADLASTILAHRCVALYGPSGAGKSSVMQAGVLPRLEDEYDFRHVAIDGWPAEESPVAWLLYTLHSELKLNPPTVEMGLYESVEWTVRQAFRRSERPILIYLDQLEQLLLPGRDVASVETFLDWLDRFAERPLRGLHLVLAMREDYLGRFRDRARGRHRLLENGFRLGPMTVREIVGAVCQAAGDGVPPQRWAAATMRALMLQVRIPGQRETDDAEVQTAFAQIVCRALFAERAARGGGQSDSQAEAPIQAEPILFRYLESTIEALGDLRGPAESLLEDHLIAVDGTRTLLTEEAALASGLGSAEELERILTDLEGAAILRAEQHRGTRYFELGHDWLAKKVFERKQERLGRQAEREQEQQRSVEAAAAAAELERAQAEARRARRVVAIVMVFALIALGLGGVAFTQQRLAKAEAERAGRAEQEARAERDRADESRSEAVEAKLLAEASLLAEAEARGAASEAADEARRQQANAEEQREAALTSEGRARLALAGQRRATAEAETQRQSAVSSLERAEVEGRRARDANRLVVALSVLGEDPTTALALLLEVEDPVRTRGWIPATVEALRSPSSSAVLRGDGGGVLAVHFSPDGEHIASALADRSVQVRRVDGAAKASELRAHAAAVIDLAFTPDGASIVTASADGEVLLWSRTAAQEPRRIAPAGASIRGLTLSPDGSRVAVAGEDGKVRLLSVDSSASPRVLAGHSGPVRALAFSPDGRSLVSAGDDKTARIWSIGGGGAVPTVLRGHGGTIYAVRYSADGTRLITASDDRSAKVWDARPVGGEGEPSPLYTLEGHGGELYSADLSAKGDRAVTASRDRTLRVWTLGTGGKATSRVLRGHEDKIYAVRFAPKGDVVASASRDGTARIWPVRGEGEARVLRGHAAAVVDLEFSPDGASLVTAGADGSARVWAVADAQGEVVLRGHRGPVRSASFDADGARLITGSEERVRIWTVRGATVKLLAELPKGTGAGKGARLSDDGGRAFVVGDEGEVEVWRLPKRRGVEARREQKIDLGLDALPEFVVVRGDGRWMITSKGDVAVLIDVRGRKRVELRGHRGRILGAAFSPDGERVATVGDDRSARVWKLSGAPLRVLRGHGGSVYDVAFSPDGRSLVTASWDRSARLWSLVGEGPPRVLAGHAEAVRGAAFSPDGRRVITASDDGTAKIWAVDGDGDTVTLYGHSGPVLSARFSRDGDRALTTSADRSARLWNVDFANPELLRGSIMETTTVCLIVEQRVKLLGEARDEAERHYGECEAGFGRAVDGPEAGDE